MHGLDRARIIVCVPGLADTWESFDALAGALPDRYGFVLIDALGHGRSSKHRGRSLPAQQCAAIASALDQLKVEPFAIVGHSYGGVIAQRFADDHPELPAVVLMATVGTMNGHPAREGLLELAESLPDDVVPEDVIGLAGESFAAAVDQALLAPYEAAMRLMPAYVMREVLVGLRDLDLSPVHGRWLPRTLLVSADNDKLMGETGMATLARALPQAEVVIIPQTSHAMHWERPEPTARAIAAVLDRV